MENIESLGEDIKLTRSRNRSILRIGIFMGCAMMVIAFGIRSYYVQKTDYAIGFQAGKKVGDSTGLALGAVQGYGKAKTEQKRFDDSLASVAKERSLALQRNARKRKKEAKTAIVQNYHVIDGKIGEPIP